MDGDDCYGFAADDDGDDYNVNHNDSEVMFDIFRTFAVPLTAHTIIAPLTFHSVIVPLTAHNKIVSFIT
jgi:hypothetical protein